MEFLFIRFINMVSNQSLYYNKISKQAKTIKANLSYEYCSYLRNKPTMRENFKQIAKLLNISNDSNIPEDLSRKDIIKGAKLFIFLNSCPNKEEYHRRNFYRNIINPRWNPTVSGMILYTINHIKRAPEDFRNISQGLLKYFASKLGFKYILPENMLNRELDIPGKLLSVYDKKQLSTVTNNPVHILNKDKNRSPSSLIPFCAFGDDMEAMGTKIDGFDLPVCSSFTAKVRNDQLCYEVDLNKFIQDKNDIEYKLKSGLVLIIDLNEDRQLKNYGPFKNESLKETAATKKDETFEIHLDTISKYQNKYNDVMGENIILLLLRSHNPDRRRTV